MKYLKISIVFTIFLLLFFFVSRNRIENFPSIKFCDNFSYYETKMICYAFFTGNTTYCKFTPNFKLECYSFATLDNLGNCGSYKDKFVKAECTKNLAIKEKDPSICDRLEDKSLQETCFSSLPYLYYDFYSSEECERILHESARYTCMAIVNKNSSFCNFIVLEPWGKNACKALAEKNPGSCNSSSCYESFAILYKDPSFCSHIDSPWDRARCVALSSKNFKYCKEFNGISKDLCRLYVLKAKALGI